MSYLRILFGLVLMALSVMLARMKVQKLELRTKALGDFLGMARQLEGLIRVNGRPIPDALMDCSLRNSGSWVGAYAEALSELYQEKNRSGSIWSAAMEKTAKQWEEAAALTPDDRQVISMFGDQLAASDIKSIGENYAFLYSRIGESLQASDKDRAVKGKLYKTVGMLAGLAAAIIVI